MDQTKGAYNFRLTGDIERRIREEAQVDHRTKHAEVYILLEEALAARERKAKGKSNG